MGASVQPKGIIDTRSAAMYYIEHLGWKLCRLNPGEKRPAGADWNQPTAVIATARPKTFRPDITDWDRAKLTATNRAKGIAKARQPKAAKTSNGVRKAVKRRAA